jgi:protocatechuate 4,5-dioxygenase, alpha chain
LHRKLRYETVAQAPDKGQQAVRGRSVSTYEVSRLLYSLREPENREACRADPEAYYRRYELDESELRLLLDHNWQGLVDAGVSIYLLTKLGATLNIELLEVGAAMRGITKDDFLRLLKEQAERNRKYAILRE